MVHANRAARTLGLLRLEGKLGLPAAEVCAGWLALAPRLVERDWRAEIQVQGAGGAPLTLEVRGLNLEAKHRQVGHLLVAADITARKRAEAALAVLALHDGLTGLANRTLLYDRLEQAIRVGEREQRPFALLVLDLDRFNDSLGHLAGDRLLCVVADRLRRLLRAEDTVARLGGDEFAVILPGANAPGGATVAANIVAGLAEPFDLEQHRVRIGASVGVAVFPDHGRAGEQLVRCADLAMYVAKRGGDGHVIYRAMFAERSIDQVMLTA